MSALHACHLGPTAYADGVRLQESLVLARASGATGDWLLFPDHPPVLTVGRNAAKGSVLAPAETLAAAGIELHESSRGGDVTWHGPGQLVGYPIVDLTVRGRDLHRYLRDLEAVLIRLLAGYGIEGVRIAGRTGVWVNGSKVASIGIAVRRWVGYHGFALNVNPDLAGFDLIHPCGLRGIEMVSLGSLLSGRVPDIASVRRRTADLFAEHMGYSSVVWASPREVRHAGGAEAA